MERSRRNRWLLRATVAAGTTVALVHVITPPGHVAGQLASYPRRLITQLSLVLAAVFLLVWAADAVRAWASRRPRTIRGSGIVCLATGIVSALLAATLWLAVLALPIAPIGVVAGLVVLRRETVNGEGHSLANLVGLVLNLGALGVLAAQVVTATIWK